MTGGVIVQVIKRRGYCYVEVLDTSSFDRQWRRLADTKDVRINDNLQWKGHKGYLSREETGQQLIDQYVGSCKPCNHPLSKSSKGK